MKPVPFNAKPSLTYAYYVYNKYRESVENPVQIDNDTASSIVKSIMIGIPPAVYTYKHCLIKGQEVMAALELCFSGKMIFTGKYFPQFDGKTYKEIPGYSRCLLDEHFILVNEIDYYVTREDVEDYFKNV